MGNGKGVRDTMGGMQTREWLVPTLVLAGVAFIVASVAAVDREYWAAVSLGLGIGLVVDAGIAWSALEPATVDVRFLGDLSAALNIPSPAWGYGGPVAVGRRGASSGLAPSPALLHQPAGAGAVYPFGDVNCDGVVDSIDSLQLPRYDAGLPLARRLRALLLTSLATFAGSRSAQLKQ